MLPERDAALPMAARPRQRTELFILKSRGLKQTKHDSPRLRPTKKLSGGGPMGNECKQNAPPAIR
jgi:hypothetical protein